MLDDFSLRLLSDMDLSLLLERSRTEPAFGFTRNSIRTSISPLSFSFLSFFSSLLINLYHLEWVRVFSLTISLILMTARPTNSSIIDDLWYTVTLRSSLSPSGLQCEKELDKFRQKSNLKVAYNSACSSHTGLRVFVRTEVKNFSLPRPIIQYASFPPLLRSSRFFAFVTSILSFNFLQFSFRELIGAYL